MSRIEQTLGGEGRTVDLLEHLHGTHPGTRFALIVGTWMRARFTSDGIPACLASSGGTGCPADITSFVNQFNHGLSQIISVPLLAIPGLLGIVVGAPLLGGELERGTWRLAWTQTVPRSRWLAAKLGLVTGGLIVFGVAVTALMTWFRVPLDQVTSRLQPGLSSPPAALTWTPCSASPARTAISWPPPRHSRLWCSTSCSQAAPASRSSRPCASRGSRSPSSC